MQQIVYKPIEVYQYCPIVTNLMIVPIGCQYTIPNGEVCSGGFIVYYAPFIDFLYI